MKIRKNTDIEKIVIHHTGHGGKITGREVSRQFENADSFGAPYDALINFDGTIDLSQRWTFGNSLSSDVSINQIFKYENHFYAGVGNQYYRLKGFHVACIGDFDVVEPGPYQFNSLINLIKTFSCSFHLSLYTSLVYFSEIERTSSPGVLFFNKKYFLFTPDCKRKGVVSARRGYGDAPFGGDEDLGWGELF